MVGGHSAALQQLVIVSLSFLFSFTGPFLSLLFGRESFDFSSVQTVPNPDDSEATSGINAVSYFSLSTFLFLLWPRFTFSLPDAPIFHSFCLSARPQRGRWARNVRGDTRSQITFKSSIFRKASGTSGTPQGPLQPNSSPKSHFNLSLSVSPAGWLYAPEMLEHDVR